MSKNNSTRKGCKDVFNAFLVEKATYDGFYEIPRIRPTYDVPERIISFSKALSTKDYDQWVHFYEDANQADCMWKKPRRYLETLREFRGVILPDFNLNREMPLVVRVWNIYRSRAMGHWLQINGIKVIPNIRCTDRRTLYICCDGIEKHCVIAIGLHGDMKYRHDMEKYFSGLDVVIKRLQPSVIVIYGTAPAKCLKKYIDAGIRIVCFESECSASHKEVR